MLMGLFVQNIYGEIRVKEKGEDGGGMIEI